MRRGYRFGKRIVAMALAGVMALGTVVCAPQLSIESEAKGLPHGLLAPSVNDDNWVEYDIVEFGKYWQEDTNGDGVADRNDEKTPIQWRVLEIDEKNDCVLLLSDKILDYQWYNAEDPNKNINAPEEVILEFSPFHQWYATEFLMKNKIVAKNSDKIWGEFNDAFEKKWGTLEKTINPFEFKKWYDGLSISQMKFFGIEFKKKWGSINGAGEPAEYPADITWERSTIRSWLNAYGKDPKNEDNGYHNDQGIDFTNADNFYMNAFEGVSGQLASNKSQTTGKNPNYSTVETGGETKDKVFLLSVEEIAKTDYGFRDYTPGTGYDTGSLSGNFGIKNGITFYDLAKVAINTPYAGGTVYGSQYNNASTANKRSVNSTCATGSYMLRTPGQAAWKVCIIDEGGNVDTTGISVCTSPETQYGVRPAIWLNLRDYSQEGYPMSDKWKKVERRAIKFPQPIPHDHVAGVEATCTTKAICKICKEYFGEKDSTKHACGEATCVEAVQCARCGYREEINPENHSFLPANCSRGVKCKLCGFEKGDVNPAVHETTPATCKAVETCTLCGKAVGEEIDRYNHVNTEIRGYIAPGVSTLGYTGDEHCADCGMMIQKGKELPAIGKWGLSNPTKDMYGNTVYDCIYFGDYWQEDTNNDNIADQNDEKTPIRWRVLSVEGDKALVMSNQTLECLFLDESYNNKFYPVGYTWDTCVTRSWLNGYDSVAVDGKDYANEYPSFIGTAFSKDERAAILKTELNNARPDDLETTIFVSPCYGYNLNAFYGDTYVITNAVNTVDQIFLLSAAEFRDGRYGFTDQYSRMLDSTHYVNKKDYEYANKRSRFEDYYGKDTYKPSVATNTRDFFYYTCQKHGCVDAYSKCEGEIGEWGEIYCGSAGNLYHEMIAPALYIDLSKTDVWTKAEPETCSVAKSPNHKHTGGEATCVQLAICDTCHQAYGEFNMNAHTGGKATCSSKAVCTVCGEEYGDYDVNNHIGTYKKNETLPTVGVPGYDGDLYCTVCNALIAKGHASYYAQYTVNGKNWEDLGQNSHYITYDTGFYLYPLEVPGYTFDGWRWSETSFSTQYTGYVVRPHFNGLKEEHVYAELKPITYTIDSYLAGGQYTTDKENPRSYTVETGYELVGADEISKFGYKFAGWYYDPWFSNKVPDDVSGKVGNIKLYAKWIPFETYEIYYYLNGGSNNENNPMWFERPNPVTILDPTREGYEFAGWYTDKALTTAFDTTKFKWDGRLSLYAKWTPTKYNLNYELNGGHYGKYQYNIPSYLVGQQFSLIEPLKADCTFEGWYLDAEFTKPFPSDTTELIGDYTLYAKWEASEVYDITYVLNGGVNSPDNPDTYTVNSGYIALSQPTKRGYTFTGWYIDENYSTPYSIYYKPAGGMTLYARWYMDHYNVTTELNGGNYGRGMPNPTYYNSVDGLRLVSYVLKDGYTFEGWYLDAACTIPAPSYEETIYMQGDIKVYAKWKEKEVYNINYELNGGKNNESNPQTYKVGGGVVALLEPTKLGNTFKGWYVDAECTQSFDGRSLGEGGVTVYAKWEANTYTITYELNGGIYAGAGVMQTTFVAGNGFTVGKELFKENYKFRGWYLDEELTEVLLEDTSLIYGDVTLYAAWEALPEYQITYELNGGQNHANNPTKYTMNSRNLNVYVPTKTGYTFDGWCLDSACSTVYVKSGKLTPIEGGMKLYAKWIPDTYTITTETNGGTFGRGGGNPTSYTTGAGFTLRGTGNITKTGYIFGGWYLDAAFTTPVPADTTSMTGNVTVYAKWTEEDSYAITYVLNGGTNDPSNPTTYKTTGGMLALMEATRAGYTFDGWYMDEQFVNRYNAAAGLPTGGLTVYAKWTANTYTITTELNGGSYVGDAANPTAYVTSVGFTLVGKSGVQKADSIFEGWYLDAAFTTPVPGDTKAMTGNITVYAKWRAAESYDITYVLNGGTNAADNPTSYKETATGITLKPATRTGYTFAGWCTDENLTNVWNSTGTLPAGGVTLYAKWNVVSYNIAYELDGGAFDTGVTPITTFTIVSGFDGVNTADRLPVKAEHAFAGWTIKKTGTEGNAVAGAIPADTKGIYGDVTLIANWDKNVFAITTELNGGAFVADATNPASYTKGVGFTLAGKKSVRKTDSIFEGWYLDAEFETPVPSDTTGLTGAVTVYAKWRDADSYVITYVLNGGTNASDNPESYKVTDDSIVLKDAGRAGYTFDGWHTDADLTTAYDAAAELPEGGFTVYAKWNVNTYQITYNLDGGAFDEEAAPVNSYTIETGFDSLFDEVNVPVKDGYAFAGWTMKQGTEEVTEIPEETKGLMGDVVIVANWKQVFTITAELYGGACVEGIELPETYVEDEGFVLPDKFSVKRRGYVFEGWFFDEEFSEEVPEDTTEINADVTVYAKWTESEACDITYMLDGGTNHPDNPVQYKLIDNGLQLKDPSKNGYAFVGWYTDEDFKHAYNVKDELPEGGITLYAKWEIVTYTITYDLDGGAFGKGVGLLKGFTIETGLDDVHKLSPSKEGYTFAGWSMKQLGEDDEEIVMDLPKDTVGIYGDVTIIAKWKEIVKPEEKPSDDDDSDGGDTPGPGGDSDEGDTPGPSGDSDDDSDGGDAPTPEITPGNGTNPGTNPGNGGKPGSTSGNGTDNNEELGQNDDVEEITSLIEYIVGKSVLEEMLKNMNFDADEISVGAIIDVINLILKEQGKN